MELNHWIIEFAGPEALTQKMVDSKENDLHLIRWHQAQDETKRLALRTAGLGRIYAEINDETFKAQLKEALGFDVEMKTGKKKSSTIEKSGDYRKAFDVVDDAQKHKGVDEKTLESIGRAAPRLFALKDYMLTATYEWTTELDKATKKPKKVKQRLFTDKDIRHDLFTPLVREGIIGDTFLVDQYSQVQNVIDETNELYLQDLQTFKGSSKAVFGAEMTDMAVKLLKDSIGAVVAGVAPVGSDGFDTGALVNTVATLVSTGVTGIKDIIVGFATQEISGGIDKGMTAFATVIGGTLTLILKNAAGMDSDSAKDWGTMVTAGIKAGGGIVKMAKTAEHIARKYKENGTVDAASLIDGLGQILEQSLTVAATATKSSDKAGSDAMKESAKWIGKSFRTGAGVTKVAETLAVRLKKTGGKLSADDWAAIISAGGEAAGKALKEFATIPLEEHKKKEEERIKDLQKKIKEGTITPEELQQVLVDTKMTKEQRDANTSASPLDLSSLSDIDAAKQGLSNRLTSMKALEKDQKSKIEGTGKTFGSMFGEVAKGMKKSDRELAGKKLLKELEEQRLKESYGMGGKDAEGKIKDAEKAIEDERQEHKDIIDRIASGGDPGYDKLAKLVAKYKIRKAVWNTLTSVGSMGMAIAQQFCSAMAIGGTIIEFAKEAALVLEHSIAIHKWKTSRGWAKDSASVFLSSVEAEVREAAQQITHHTIQAALLMVKVVGQIVATVGAAAQGIGFIIGQVIEKSAQAARTAEELIYKIVRKAQVVKAWKRTKKALENPSNRRLGLEVRAMNATLAKYTLAYGAYVEKDAIARMALAKFGIDDQALENADAGLAQVRMALESLFAEDKVVKGMAPYKVGWAKDINVELTVTSWFSAYSKAVNVGNLMKDPPPNHIRDAFQHLLVAASGFKRDPDDPLASKEMDGALFRLEYNLKDWNPRMETDPRHVCREMHQLREKYLDEVAKVRGALPKLPSYL